VGVDRDVGYESANRSMDSEGAYFEPACVMLAVPHAQDMEAWEFPYAEVFGSLPSPARQAGMAAVGDGGKVVCETCQRRSHVNN